MIYEFDAIGTRWWLEALDEHKISDELKGEIDAYVTRFTQEYSRFIDDSVVVRLQEAGRLENPSEEMRKMLDFAKEMFDVSDGAFNISIGGSLHKKGYGKKARAGKVDKNIWGHIVYDDTLLTVPRDMMLDFGGFGKGWMIDSIVAMFRGRGYKKFIVNGGGDLFVESDDPVEVMLEHPLKAGVEIGKTQLQHAALAASSTLKRTWRDGDTDYHHIFDPETGSSSDGDVVAAFVAGPTALITDTLATILILRPELRERLEYRYGVQIILLTREQLA